jgi:hypothetical protein
VRIVAAGNSMSRVAFHAAGYKAMGIAIDLKLFRK